MLAFRTLALGVTLGLTSALLAAACDDETSTSGSSADDATGATGSGATGSGASGAAGGGGQGAQGGGSVGGARGCSEGPTSGAGGCAQTCVTDEDCGTVFCGCGPGSGTTPSKKCWDGCCPDLDPLCDWACKDAFGCDAGAS